MYLYIKTVSKVASKNYFGGGKKKHFLLGLM